MLVRLAIRSLLNRKLSVFLMVFAMAVGASALLLTRTLSSELERGFNSSVSGTDLIVGARSHPVQVVLYSVFRIGAATQSMTWQRYQEVKNHPNVSWTFPIALGDSHRGYPVVGTDEAYFEHYKYSSKRALAFSSGGMFSKTNDVVLGAAVARERNYQLGDKLFLSHGLGGSSFVEHKESNFVVSGILKPTGTPIDRSLHVHHKALEALHLPQWKYKLGEVTLDELPNPRVISSAFVGLKSRFMTFAVQRELNGANKEPLTAVIPGVGLSQLWRMMGSAENVLNILAGLMLVVSLVGMAAMLQSTVVGRMSEIALFRMMGARPLLVLFLIELEVVLLVLIAWLVAVVLALVAQWGAQGFLADTFGVDILIGLPMSEVGAFAGVSLLLGLLVGVIPALSVYKMALNKQLFHAS